MIPHQKLGVKADQGFAIDQDTTEEVQRAARGAVRGCVLPCSVESRLGWTRCELANSCDK